MTDLEALLRCYIENQEDVIWYRIQDLLMETGYCEEFDKLIPLKFRLLFHFPPYEDIMGRMCVNSYGEAGQIRGKIRELEELILIESTYEESLRMIEDAFIAIAHGGRKHLMNVCRKHMGRQTKYPHTVEEQDALARPILEAGSD